MGGVPPDKGSRSRALKPIGEQMNIAVASLCTDLDSAHQTNPQLLCSRHRRFMRTKGIVIGDSNRPESSNSGFINQCGRRIRPIALKGICMKVYQASG